MRFKILFGKVIAFFAGQRSVKGHKNIIDSIHQRIVSPKTFIGAHSSIQSQSAVRCKGYAYLYAATKSAETILARCPLKRGAGTNQSGLLMRIATTESGSLCAQMKS
jgi:hypothetical protein